MTSRSVIPLLVLSFLGFGVLNGLTADDHVAGNVLGVLQMIVTAFLLYAWIAHDAAGRDATLSTAMLIGLIVFGVFAMPFYLYRARPRAAMSRWLAKGMLLLAVCIGGHVAMFDLAWRVAAG